MKSTTIIRKPVVTEKATIDSNEYNRFTFEVDRRGDEGPGQASGRRHLQGSAWSPSLPRFARARPAA